MGSGRTFWGRWLSFDCVQGRMLVAAAFASEPPRVRGVSRQLAHTCIDTGFTSPTKVPEVARASAHKLLYRKLPAEVQMTGVVPAWAWCNTRVHVYTSIAWWWPKHDAPLS